jgi:hypothetical protein
MRKALLGGVLTFAALGCTPASLHWVDAPLPATAAEFVGCYAFRTTAVSGEPPLNGTWELTLDAAVLVSSRTSPDSAQVRHAPWRATIQQGMQMPIDTGSWQPRGTDSVLVHVVGGRERQGYSLRWGRAGSYLSGTVRDRRGGPDPSVQTERTATILGTATPCG